MELRFVDPRALNKARHSKSNPQADALLLATIKAVGIVQTGRSVSTRTRADERLFQQFVAELTLARRGEIDALTRKLERQELAIAAL